MTNTFPANCYICNVEVIRERQRVPVLCSPRCRARLKKARARTRRAYAELLASLEVFAEWGIAPPWAPPQWLDKFWKLRAGKQVEYISTSE